MLEYPNKIRDILTVLGFRMKSPPYGINAKGISFILLSLYMSIQTTYSMIKYWNDMPTRFSSIEHFIITMIVNLVLIQYALRPKDIVVALEISEEKYFGYKESFIEEEEEFINRSFQEINYGADFVYKMLIAEFFAFALSPLIFIGWTFFIDYYTMNGNTTGTLEVKDFPLLLSYGFQFTCFYTYACVYAVQAVYLFSAIMFAYCFSTASIFSIHSTTMNVAFFNIALRYFDQMFGEFIDTSGENDEDVSRVEIHMRDLLREIVIQHTLIYRKSRVLTEKIGITLTVINNALTLLICFDIYTFVKGTDTVLRFSCLCRTIPRIGILYLYSLKGQKLINEYETMYQSISELLWVDKPKWFKQCLLMMLTRSIARLQVKPFGLYVIDLRNFSVVINAAYSYFSIFLRLS